MSVGGGGYGAFQGHMSAHDLALNRGTQQMQGGANSVPLLYLTCPHHILLLMRPNFTAPECAHLRRRTCSCSMEMKV